ncbi:hypothetical protein DN402_05745 [Streptomyces sp. SW4]|nr:hypothetical protein DN402_05745 [Streptomyces sp. SW4]
MCGTGWKCAGIMWDGSRDASAARRPAAGVSVTTWATIWRLPWACRATWTAASRTPGSATRAARTSPSSTRLPLIFTWSSRRPRWVSVPPGSSRTRSPVR